MCWAGVEIVFGALIWVVRQGPPERVTFQQRLEFNEGVSPASIWGTNVQDSWREE